jgi:hypothetical protein
MRYPVSVICVFNNAAVLEDCLTASVEAGMAEAPKTEYIPVDNTAGQFSSAGAALNHGASLARNEVVVFVHQDVYLHSLAALEESAGVLHRDGSVGLVGAIGVTAEGRLLGLIRDRVIFSGESSSALSDVDSLDEVLFMARREQIILHPLAEDQDLSWHAYAVEYGLRLRSLGLRVAATDIPLTHNSLTINLDRLAEAHAWIAKAYPAQMPVETTCGRVREASTINAVPLFGGVFETHKWRYRWLRESLSAHRLRRQAKVVTVLGDIRRDIDEFCSAASLDSMLVISAAPISPSAFRNADPLELNRRNVRFTFLTADQTSIPALVRSRPEDQSIAVTNIGFEAAQHITDALRGRPVLLGFHENTGPWLLIGPAVAAALPHYRTQRSTPFAMRTA